MPAASLKSREPAEPARERHLSHFRRLELADETREPDRPAREHLQSLFPSARPIVEYPEPEVSTR